MVNVLKFSNMKLSLYTTIIIGFVSSSLISQDQSYFGGWPINNAKDQIKDPGFSLDCDNVQDKGQIGCECVSDDDCYSGRCFNSPRVGKYCMQNTGTVFPRYTLMDQYGELVDLYDFAGHGKLIVIEFSTSWCQPCKDFASWMSFDDQTIISHQFWKQEYGIIKELIREEKIYFINIQAQDKYRNPSSLDSVEEWAYEYPDEMIPIFSDPNYEVRNWARVTAYPTMIILNDKMEIIKFSVRGWQDALKFLSDIKWDFKDSDEINKKGSNK